jgi:hypothetical protein
LCDIRPKRCIFRVRYEHKKTWIDSLSKTLKDEADNAGNIAQCAAAAGTTPTPGPVAGAKAPLTSEPQGAFSVVLAVNHQGCTGTPDHNCLKEFDFKRGQGAPTPPLRVVASQLGFPVDNYALIIEGRHRTLECPGKAECTWDLPGFKATDPIPVEDDFSASLKWLGKKDRQRDKGGAGSIVDGVAARVYVHYPAP